MIINARLERTRANEAKRLEKKKKLDDREKRIDEKNKDQTIQAHEKILVL